MHPRLLAVAASLAVLLGIGSWPAQTGADAASAVPVAAAAVARPNIVVFMADDMRADDVRFMPQLRRLVKEEGLTFRNSFSPYPLCCPARASFLSGQYAHNHRVLSNEHPFGFGSFDDSRTLATSLQSAGYNTGFVGKYLNYYGISRSRVTGEHSWHYVPAGWTDWYGAVQRPERLADRYPVGGTYHYFHPIFNVNGRTVEYPGRYQTSVLGRLTRGLVTEYGGSSKPFFLYVSALAPHHGAPHEPGDVDAVRNGDRLFEFLTPARPDRVKGRYDREVRRAPGLPAGGGTSEADVTDKPLSFRNPVHSARERRLERDLTRQRAESLAVLDEEVGLTVAKLREVGELDETVFLFTSDNGYFLGEHRFRAGKSKAYEPSIRVPLLLIGPGIPHGVRNDPATTMDLSATILDLADAQPPRRPDGRSLVGSFQADHGWDHAVVTEATLSSPRYRASRARGFHDARSTIGLRTARWKLIRYSTGFVELYDLDRDPNELRNLARLPAYADVRRALTRIWWSLKDCTGRECLAELPPRFALTADEAAATTRRQQRGVLERFGVAF